MKLASAFPVLVVALLSSSAALATEPNPGGRGVPMNPNGPAQHSGGSGFVGDAHHEFGEEGTIALEASTGLDFSSTSTKAAVGDDPKSTTHIRLEPTFHYFIMENLSIGGLLSFDYTKQGDAKEQAIGIGPQVGYNLAVADNLSFWPRVGAQYVLVSMDEGNGSASGSKIQAVIDAPLLVHIASHFHFGIGPYVRMDLTSKMESEDANKDTKIGLAGTIGGWF